MQLKILIVLIVTVMVPIMLLSQIPQIQKKNCYDKLDSRKGQKYAEWECGKLAGVVDCNEKLTYDNDTKTILSGNAGAPFTGTCETCHLNGLLERRISFINGKENGIDTTFYKSGCPQVVRNHILGAESGQWFYFYDSTQTVAWENNYYLGSKHGKQLYLTKEGDTTRLEYYANGKLDGVKKSYYPESKLEKEVHYKDGIMDGPYFKYSRKGILLEELHFKQGKKDGELRYYYNDGKPLSIEHWSMDLKNGEFKTFFYDGKPQSTENYKKGIPVGWFEERFSNSKMKHSALYDKKGVLIEEHKFDEQGNETYTFGVEPTKDKEDDAVPGMENTSKTKKKDNDKKLKGGSSNDQK
jgi:antitoxin component YwqK of YwqJK toxin-antitoxin module